MTAQSHMQTVKKLGWPWPIKEQAAANLVERDGPDGCPVVGTLEVVQLVGIQYKVAPRPMLALRICTQDKIRFTVTLVVSPASYPVSQPPRGGGL